MSIQATFGSFISCVPVGEHAANTLVLFKILQNTIAALRAASEMTACRLVDRKAVALTAKSWGNYVASNETKTVVIPDPAYCRNGLAIQLANKKSRRICQVKGLRIIDTRIPARFSHPRDRHSSKSSNIQIADHVFSTAQFDRSGRVCLKGFHSVS